ncbi:MAG: carboxylesterase family protein [Polyangiales bacterium]
MTGTATGSVAAFLGIPYVAPPVGALRWRPPQAVTPWTAPRDATRKGPACPQAPGLLLGAVPTDEDCLTLNVWTGASDVGRAEARRPVMVFIHGGGFTAGSVGGLDYDGARLAERGVVLVNFQYRLGQLGFLAHPALTAEETAAPSSGNYGFLDQVAALRWVRDNAAAFGGDPNNVTIFGESAGGISICLHMVSPLSSGLFHRAISESGPCSFLVTPLDGPSTPGLPQSAYSLGRQFATTAGCADRDDVPACLRAKSAAEVIAAEPRNFELDRLAARWQPNIDGRAITEAPWTTFLAGRSARVPFLTGANLDEGTAFTLTATINDDAAYREAVRALLPERVDDVLRLYPSAMFRTPKAAFTTFVGDAVFVCPARAQARAHAASGQRAYLYHFTRLNRAGTLLGLGVYHTAELPYVFGNYAGFFTRAEADVPVEQATMGYWTRFAATGDPNGAGAVAWPAYDATGDAYLEIGDAVRASTGLTAARCAEIEGWFGLNPR